MSDTEILCVETDGPAATQALAEAISATLADGDLLVLTGDLGAGKTCFTQGLGRGLGVDDRITSPTFTLVATHEGRLRLNHLDVYRLDNLGETLDLDLPDLLEDGVTVVEWGELIDAVLPEQRLLVELRFAEGLDRDDDYRLIRFDLTGSAWERRRAALIAATESWRASC